MYRLVLTFGKANWCAGQTRLPQAAPGAVERVLPERYAFSGSLREASLVRENRLFNHPDLATGPSQFRSFGTEKSPAIGIALLRALE